MKRILIGFAAALVLCAVAVYTGYNERLLRVYANDGNLVVVKASYLSWSKSRDEIRYVVHPVMKEFLKLKTWDVLERSVRVVTTGDDSPFVIVTQSYIFDSRLQTMYYELKQPRKTY